MSWLFENLQAIINKRFASSAQSKTGTATDVISNPLGVAEYVGQFKLGTLAPGVHLPTVVDLNNPFGGWAYFTPTSTNTPNNSYGIVYTLSENGKYDLSSTLYQKAISPYGVTFSRTFLVGPGWGQWRAVWDSLTLSPQAPRQVWGGSATSVPMSALSEQGAGFYLIQGNTFSRPVIQICIQDTSKYQGTVGDINSDGSFAKAMYSYDGNFTYTFGNITSPSQTNDNVTAIWKI